jgi:hypothetical protein
MKNKKAEFRKFLNPKTGSAHVMLDMNTDNGGTLTISDCHRQVSLEFDWYNFDDTGRIQKGRIKAAQKKLAILREALDKADEIMEQALGDV